MIGQRIQLLREELNLSKAELAERIQISPSAMGNYERGDRTPDGEVIKRLAGYFNVSADYLLGIIDNRTHAMSSVAETVGLSDDAILNIQDLRYSGYLEALNAFLGCRAIDTLIRYVSDYANHKYENIFILEKRLISASGSTELIGQLSDLLSTLTKSDMDAFLMNRAINTFRDLLEKIQKVDPLEPKEVQTTKEVSEDN